jgi:hypothetical protein
MAKIRCGWCDLPGTATDGYSPLLMQVDDTSWACKDGMACANRAGELLWATSPSEARQYGGTLSGRYCCLDTSCTHPREQVFNGGAE